MSKKVVGLNNIGDVVLYHLIVILCQPLPVSFVITPYNAWVQIDQLDS